MPQNLAGLPSDFYLEDGTVDTSKYTLVKTAVLTAPNWNLRLTDLPKTDSNGNAYVYYMRECALDGWIASYTGNGQTADSTTAMTITNTKTIEKTSISVKKEWVDAANATHIGVTIALYRKLETASAWETTPVDTHVLSNEN